MHAYWRNVAGGTAALIASLVSDGGVLSGRCAAIKVKNLNRAQHMHVCAAARFVWHWRCLLTGKHVCGTQALTCNPAEARMQPALGVAGSAASRARVEVRCQQRH